MSWLLLIVVAAGVFLLDQVTKALVMANLPLNEPWAPIPSLAHIFTLTYITNTGAVFGILPEAGAAFLVIQIVVVILIIYYYRHLPDGGGWLIRLALGLQLGGALGNLLDRVRLGHVVDFLHLSFWPVFNVADSGIVTGVVILAGAMLWEDRRARRPAAGKETPPAAD